MLEWFEKQIKNAGPHMALVIFFVWQGQGREERMSSRQTELEKYCRTELSTISKDYSKAMEKNSDVLERVLQKLK